MTTTVLIIIALLHTPAVWVIAGAAAVAALITREKAPQMSDPGFCQCTHCHCTLPPEIGGICTECLTNQHESTR